jgi:hypothetical protein
MCAVCISTLDKWAPYPVDAVEEAIMNYGAIPEGMNGWRRYRLEYGGHAQECEMECIIYLPPWASAEAIEQMIRGAQYSRGVDYDTTDA